MKERTIGARLVRQTRWLGLLMVVVLLLNGCGSTGGSLFGGRSALLGDRKASDPLAAAEAYLRQYQPGELPRVFQTTRIYDRHGHADRRDVWRGPPGVGRH